MIESIANESIADSYSFFPRPSPCFIFSFKQGLAVMEGNSKQDEAPRSRKNQARALLKRCFKNPIFSFVPFEIWKDILCEGEATSIVRISQTCWGFKELVDSIRELLLEWALKYRREEKIEMARELIMRCAVIGNSRAMFHIAHAYWSMGGWGLNTDVKKAAEWFRKSAECGNAFAIPYFAYCLSHEYGVEKDEEWGNVWAKKAQSSNNSFAVGYCHFYRLGTLTDRKKAFESFKISAEEGDEYGQDMLGYCFQYGKGVVQDQKKAFHWLLKSAEQGFANAQHNVGYMYLDGKGCEKNYELSKIWFQKARNQRGQ